jgi:hypothetical protein
MTSKKKPSPELPPVTGPRGDGDPDGIDFEADDPFADLASPSADNPFSGWVTPGPAPAFMPDGKPNPDATKDSEAEAQGHPQRRNRLRGEILRSWAERAPRDRDFLLFLEVAHRLARKPGTNVIDEPEKERQIERLLAGFRRGELGNVRLLADPDRPFTPSDLIKVEGLGWDTEGFRLGYVYPMIFDRDAVAAYFGLYGIEWPAAWGDYPTIARPSGKAKPGPKPVTSRDDTIRTLLRAKKSRTPLKTFADKVRTACDAKESTHGFSDERISRRARQVERELQTETDSAGE